MATIAWRFAKRLKRKNKKSIAYHLVGNAFLFVIFRSVQDGKGTVDCFEQQYAHELMGEGECRNGQAIVSGLFDARGKTVRTADDQHEI